MFLLFLLHLLPLLPHTLALNLTSSPLPTSGPLQSWTPNISFSTHASSSQTMNPSKTYCSSYTPNSESGSDSSSSSYSFSPYPTRTQTSLSSQTPSSQTPSSQTPSSQIPSSQPSNQQVSIYDTLTFKTGVGISSGIIILIWIFICMKLPSSSKQIPVPVITTTPFAKIAEPLPSDAIIMNEKLYYKDKASGKLLAEGWKSETDETGDIWYVKLATGESSWSPTYKE